MAIRLIMVGKRPLQGTKLLVRMAMSRSRGLSMMRQPVTPAALQPGPCTWVVHFRMPFACILLSAMEVVSFFQYAITTYIP